MTADSTVEWGEDRRVRWWDRFLGDPDGTGRLSLSAPALAAAAVAFALMLAAELTPWTVANTIEVHLGEVGGFQLLAYHLGWMALLALIGVTLVARPEIRRLLMAGGLGAAAALLVVTAGVARQASTGGPFAGPERPVETDLGSGAYFGLAGVVVAAVALILTGWHPGVRLRRRADAVEELAADAGPADLTVTPLQ